MVPASACLPFAWSTGGQFGYYWVSLSRIARVREENGERYRRLRDEHQRTSHHPPCVTLVICSRNNKMLLRAPQYGFVDLLRFWSPSHGLGRRLARSRLWDVPLGYWPSHACYDQQRSRWREREPGFVPRRVRSIIGALLGHFALAAVS